MKKLNLLIFFVLITILTSDISTQADIKNKELYFELENKAVKNEDSLKDILEFSTQLKKSGEVNYKGKTYDIWLEKDNKSIGGKERKVVGISIVNKDSLHILEQYFIAYNNDRSIDYFKLSDAKDANKNSWIITDYPVDHGGWASERRFYEDKKKIFSMVDGNKKMQINGFLVPFSLQILKVVQRKTGLLGELKPNILKVQ